MNKNSQLVYSTQQGKHCPQCQRAKAQCICKKSPTQPTDKNATIYLSRETKGRKGAGVTLIEGVPLVDTELKDFAKKLKTFCGVGGSIKNSIIELQGDQREKIKPLIAQTFTNTIKFKGG